MGRTARITGIWGTTNLRYIVRLGGFEWGEPEGATYTRLKKQVAFSKITGRMRRSCTRGKYNIMKIELIGIKSINI